MKRQPVKGHLPGPRACEARQVWNAFRDSPAARKFLLAEAMRKAPNPNPCEHHDYLNNQREDTEQ